MILWHKVRRAAPNLWNWYTLTWTTFGDYIDVTRKDRLGGNLGWKNERYIKFEFYWIHKVTWCRHGLRLLESWTHFAKPSAKSDPETGRSSAIIRVTGKRLTRIEMDIFLDLQSLQHILSLHLWLSRCFVFQVVSVTVIMSHITSPPSELRVVTESRVDQCDVMTGACGHHDPCASFSLI